MFSGPMLNETNFDFSLSAPSPLPAYLNVHYICETASRLLFLSMHWARAVGAFQLLKSVNFTNLYLNTKFNFQCVLNKISRYFVYEHIAFSIFMLMKVYKVLVLKCCIWF